MLAYPITLIADDNDTVMVTAPDFPELTTFGDDREEAMARARDALEEAILARIHAHQDLPAPSLGSPRVALSPLIAAQLVRHRIRSASR